MVFGRLTTTLRGLPRSDPAEGKPPSGSKITVVISASWSMEIENCPATSIWSVGSTVSPSGSTSTVTVVDSPVTGFARVPGFMMSSNTILTSESRHTSTAPSASWSRRMSSGSPPDQVSTTSTETATEGGPGFASKIPREATSVQSRRFWFGAPLRFRM